MNDRFSVIVLCYNNSKYLTNCLDSILIQTHRDIELIVADDHSIDFDIKYFENYIETHKGTNLKRYVVYQNPENYGTVKNLNCALKLATGEYIKDIAADDALYDSNVLATVVAEFGKVKNDFIVSRVQGCDMQMQPMKEYRLKLQETVNDITADEYYAGLCIRNGIVATGVFFRKSFFEKHGNFDESYRLLEDWPKWLVLAKQGVKPWFMDCLTAKYRVNGGVGTSVNQLLLADKQRVMDTIIVPSKKQIGLKNYTCSRIYFALTTSKAIRKIYGWIFR